MAINSPRSKICTIEYVDRTSTFRPIYRHGTEFRNAYPGVRHRTLLLAANSLGRLVGAGLLDLDHAHAVLADAAHIHVGVEGFTAAEAERTITDGLTYAATRTTGWH
ncbi:hypothetical protein [Nocardia sp. SC052]|uniref:hypothetical protein n=1 Tax=Nocardia sichangensis TaxID=3385975 RepID=UPI0039A01D51